MVEIGGYPIIWHIMNIYAAASFKEFVVAVGYKGEVIKEYFLNYHPHASDVTVRLSTGAVRHANNKAPDWTVSLVDTGAQTQTGGRLKRLHSWVTGGTFMMTYADGVSNIDIQALVAFHKKHGRLATVTAVRPPARFGGLLLDKDQVVEFKEKPATHQTEEGWINGGFFVLEPQVLDYIAGDSTAWELEPLAQLTAAGQLMAYRHEGFWAPMDTLREKIYLQSLWESGKAPWKVW
jgi:glucose-1-phosphate cytidylyltransferase